MGSNGHCYITHREYTAGMEHLQRWLVSELNLRDKAVDIARSELRQQLEHLNNLRQGVVMKDSFERSSESVDEKFNAVDGRVKLLEAYRNKGIGVVLTVTALSGVFGGIIGYTIAGLFGP